MRKDVGVWKENVMHFFKEGFENAYKMFESQWNQFVSDEDGMGVVEVILIIVVLISLVIIFKKQITDVVKSIMNSIEKDSKSVYGS